MDHGLLFNPEHRLEEGATATDTLYLAERQAHDQTKKAFSEAQEVNQELLGRVEEANEKIEHLLEDMERSVY
jgi:myosin-5